MSIQQRIEDGEFEVPYDPPAKPDFKTIDSKSAEKIAREQYDALYAAWRTEYWEREYKARARFFAALAEDNGVVGNPKLKKLEEIAWDLGHSSGFYEVANYYNHLVDLIDPRVA